MFIHTVFFWLNDSVTEQEKKFFRESLHKLATVEHIQAAHVAKPAPTRRDVIDSSYDFSLTFIFDSQSDQDLYQPHPVHKEFIANCSHLWEKVVVYDTIPA